MAKFDVAAAFEKYSDEEFLEFDRIPLKDRRHQRPDLCVMLYMHEKLKGETKDCDAVSGAEHDEIWFTFKPTKLTDEDVLYLVRCGIRYDSDTGGLCSFV